MWFRRVASRFGASMVASASWSAKISPVTLARCAWSPGSGATVSNTSARPVSVTIVPVSPSWPPPSAKKGVRSKKISAVPSFSPASTPMTRAGIA